MTIPIVSAYTFLNTIGKLTPSLPLLVNPHCLIEVQWGKVSKGTKPLPISYTTWYVPVVAYGNNQNWQPENSAVTAYQTSLSQLNIYAKEGAFFWFITIGK